MLHIEGDGKAGNCGEYSRCLKMWSVVEEKLRDVDVVKEGGKLRPVVSKPL